VVELDPPPELEGPGQAVRRDLPRLGEPGDDVRAVVRRGDERLEDLVGDAERVEPERLPRIEPRRLGLHADHQRVPSGLSPGDAGQAGDEQEHAGDRSDCSHVTPPPGFGSFHRTSWSAWLIAEKAPSALLGPRKSTTIWPSPASASRACGDEVSWPASAY